MYNATVYKIMFGAPSDVIDEKNAFFLLFKDEIIYTPRKTE